MARSVLPNPTLPAPLESVRCNLCAGQDTAPWLQKDGFTIVRCRRCGLVYVNPRLAAEAVTGQYDEGYYTDGSYADYLGEQPGYEKTFERRLQKIEKLARPGRILDVGCAFGFFLNAAGRRGWEAYGVDVSPAACRYATEELGARAIRGTAAQAGFAPGFFDVVILNDAFEHLADPAGELAAIRRLLRPGGYLVLVTQDISRPLVRLLGRRWAQYKPREHLYYYTAATLRALLNKTGYRCLSIRDEGLICTVDFLVIKLRNGWRPLGQAASWLVRRLGAGQALVPMRTGYEVMVIAQRIED